MQSQNIEIINKLGLHARAAAVLVKLSNEFQSNIFLSKEANQANSKNIMEVLMLAATQGTRLTITIEGPDEEKAMQAIVDLINDRFHESE